MEASTQPPEVRATSASVNVTAHHARHHHKIKKGSDPFTDANIDLSVLPSPTSDNGPDNKDSHSHSLLADLVLTPLTMISFLLSLSLVDRQQRQWRLSQHSSADRASAWSRLTSWLYPEPYQDSRDATWKHNSDGPTQTGDANTYNGWYRQKKHRAMAKMEISDAFEMRRRVLFAFAAWAILGFFALTYAARRMYGWISRA